VDYARYLGFACVGLVLALVATTTVMAVQDRVCEHALLQTLGFSGPLIFRLVIAESVLIGLAGGVLGVGGRVGAAYGVGLGRRNRGRDDRIHSDASVGADWLGRLACRWPDRRRGPGFASRPRGDRRFLACGLTNWSDLRAKTRSRKENLLCAFASWREN